MSDFEMLSIVMMILAVIVATLKDTKKVTAPGQGLRLL